MAEHDLADKGLNCPLSAQNMLNPAPLPRPSLAPPWLLQKVVKPRNWRFPPYLDVIYSRPQIQLVYNPEA
ncbi:MAG: hypothetical protein O3A85_04355 [Proteobacteria bacterium]|nr:hypothetical protein [Pseudomonadota bacterium]